MFKQATLRSVREKNKYSVEDIALICGITVEDVKRYEDDTRKMPFDLARKAKRLFHINIEQIFIGPESEYTKDHS